MPAGASEVSRGGQCRLPARAAANARSSRIQFIRRTARTANGARHRPSTAGPEELLPRSGGVLASGASASEPSSMSPPPAAPLSRPSQRLLAPLHGLQRSLPLRLPPLSAPTPWRQR
jgi:hypothetical protein